MLTHTTPKYRCFTAFILALLWASPASAASDGAFIRGDANADGAVDIADAKSILSYLFHGARLGACGDAADANDDAIAITDVTANGDANSNGPAMSIDDANDNDDRHAHDDVKGCDAANA